MFGSRVTEDQIDERLQQAYAAFVDGRPTREDCEIIVLDLANYSGYYNTTPIGVPVDDLKQIEGMREVFGRIVRYANMPLAELNAIHRKVIEIQTGDV